MPLINNNNEIPRKKLNVFYVLDTSGSMEGAKISALNHAMEECTEALKSIAKSNGDAQLQLAVLEFNSGCKWMTPNGPEDLEEDFEYEYLNAGGLTDIGAALEELNSKLSTHAFLNSMTGNLMPVIIFMTDGYATDDYESALLEIRENRWFKHGVKIGFALGEEPDVKMLSSVVGNSEAVIKTTDLELFKKLIKFVTVRSSMLVSQSQTKDVIPSGAGIVKDILEEEKTNGGLSENPQIYLEENDYNYETLDDDSDDDWGDDEEWL